MQSARNYKRIVVKIGSSLLYSQGRFDCAFIDGVCAQVAELTQAKKEVLIVSSGAIAGGMSVLKLKERPRKIAYLQAAAAIGQHELMGAYRRFLEARGSSCAQVLLTWEDFSQRKRYLNAKNTLSALLKLGSIPIINENDTVSTDEIKFGDNDRLSALVASLVSADLLIILSDVDGLLDKEKRLIPLVAEITSQIKGLASPTDKKTCVGGMITKLEAAKIAMDSGIPCLIACGRRKDIIISAAKDPQNCGTLFVSKKSLSARERWIAFGTRPGGRIVIDEGAIKALRNRKSLLSVGVVSCQGSFSAGDIVSIRDKEAREIARGKTGISARELDNLKGMRSDKEVIHCDNIVIL